MVLERALWGVDFFMVCDHDAVTLDMDASTLEAKANGKLRMLKRYHLENYFLDENVISKIFEPLEPPESPLRNPTLIAEMLRQVAREYLSYAASLIVSAAIRERAGNVDVMPKGADNKSVDEIAAAIVAAADQEKIRIGKELGPEKTRELVEVTMRRLT